MVTKAVNRGMNAQEIQADQRNAQFFRWLCASVHFLCADKWHKGADEVTLSMSTHKGHFIDWIRLFYRYNYLFLKYILTFAFGYDFWLCPTWACERISYAF